MCRYVDLADNPIKNYLLAQSWPAVMFNHWFAIFSLIIHKLLVLLLRIIWSVTVYSVILTNLALISTLTTSANMLRLLHCLTNKLRQWLVEFSRYTADKEPQCVCEWSRSRGHQRGKRSMWCKTNFTQFTYLHAPILAKATPSGITVSGLGLSLLSRRAVLLIMSLFIVPI